METSSARDIRLKVVIHRFLLAAANHRGARCSSKKVFGTGSVLGLSFVPCAFQSLMSVLDIRHRPLVVSSG